MAFKKACRQRGGRNVENQNIEGSERRKYFQDDQNVERSERQKSERQKERQKSKNDFRRSDLF